MIQPLIMTMVLIIMIIILWLCPMVLPLKCSQACCREPHCSRAILHCAQLLCWLALLLCCFCRFFSTCCPYCFYSFWYPGCLYHKAKRFICSWCCCSSCSMVWIGFVFAVECFCYGAMPSCCMFDFQLFHIFRRLWLIFDCFWFATCSQHIISLLC